MTQTWMIYGATGYTGQLITAEAVKRGHTPLLAGRTLEKVIVLSEKYGLDGVVISLDQRAELIRAVAGVDLVFHAAGPFTQTAGPMQTACLLGKTHYLDITGEISVFENTFALDTVARRQDICMISRAGFDVIPTDCLACYVAQQVPQATDLEIGVAAALQASAGTTKSMLEMMPGGILSRRDGALVPAPDAYQPRRLKFPKGEATTLPIPWGDISTAYRSTGIPNIKAYLALPPSTILLLRLFGGLGQAVLSLRPLRRLFQILVDLSIKGSKTTFRESTNSHIWAKASNDEGIAVEAWLETMEPYQFTAVAGVRFVEQILANSPVGALSPAQAVGADFIMDLAETHRLDRLD